MATISGTSRVTFVTIAFATSLLAIDPPALVAQNRDRPASSLDVDFDALRPGLIATYRSLVEGDAGLTRIDAKPAFSLGRSNPHPRIPPGPFEVVWTGVLYVKDPGPIRFDAYVCGEVVMEVDGVRVIQGRGETDTSHVAGIQALTREIGLYRLRVRSRSLPDRPPRLEPWGAGPGVGPGPPPAGRPSP